MNTEPTRRPRDEWRAEIREVNAAGMSAGWRAFLWVAATVTAITSIVVALWAAGVLFSGPKGAGDQTRITNDGRNRVNSQEWFEGQYQQIVTADQRIGVADTARKAAPADEVAAANYYGTVNRCLEMAGNYNAEARKVSRGQWRAADLPFQIDPSDPATDCKEPTK